MSNRNPHPPDSQPDDLVGKDGNGRVRIDRVIPLHWVMGIIGAGVINAATTYYGQQQLAEKVGEMRTEIRAITATLSNASTQDMAHSIRLQSLERRVDQLETRKP